MKIVKDMKNFDFNQLKNISNKEVSELMHTSAYFTEILEKFYGLEAVDQLQLVEVKCNQPEIRDAIMSIKDKINDTMSSIQEMKGQELMNFFLEEVQDDLEDDLKKVINFDYINQWGERADNGFEVIIDAKVALKANPKIKSNYVALIFKGDVVDNFTYGMQHIKFLKEMGWW